MRAAAAEHADAEGGELGGEGIDLEVVQAEFESLKQQLDTANANLDSVQMNPVHIVSNEVWTQATPASARARTAGAGAASARSVEYAIPFERPTFNNNSNSAGAASPADIKFTSGGKVYSIPTEATVSASQAYAVPSELKITSSKDAWKSSSSV